jgi:hypothetical protein
VEAACKAFGPSAYCGHPTWTDPLALCDTSPFPTRPPLPASPRPASYARLSCLARCTAGARADTRPCGRGAVSGQLPVLTATATPVSCRGHHPARVTTPAPMAHVDVASFLADAARPSWSHRDSALDVVVSGSERAGRAALHAPAADSFLSQLKAAKAATEHTAGGLNTQPPVLVGVPAKAPAASSAGVGRGPRFEVEATGKLRSFPVPVTRAVHLCGAPPVGVDNATRGVELATRRVGQAAESGTTVGAWHLCLTDTCLSAAPVCIALRTPQCPRVPASASVVSLRRTRAAEPGGAVVVQNGARRRWAQLPVLGSPRAGGGGGSPRRGSRRATPS